jgi:hypothetical protein
MPCTIRRAGWTGGTLVGVALVGVALVALAASLGAQEATQLINNKQEDAFRSIRFQFQQKMLTGQDTSATKEQLELASRFYVSRVTYATAHSDSKLMGTIVKDFEDMIGVALGRNVTNNRELLAKATPLFVQRFKEIFELDFKANRISIVNAAVMLPHFAKLKQDEIGDFLAALVDDAKKHDAIRVHALKGLREYFPAKAFTKFEAENKQTLEKKDRDLRRVGALVKVVDRKMPPMNDPQKIGAFRYVRKEAVASLAEAQIPAVLAKDGKIEGLVALALVKVLAQKTEPTPSIGERLEAGIGICNMKARDVEEYDPAIGVYLFGVFLTDLVSEYKKDLNNIKQALKNRQPTYFAWKVESKRLDAAISELMRNTGPALGKDLPKLQAFETAARAVLRDMYGSDAIGREQDLRKAVQNLRPKTKILFKDNKGSKPIEFDLDQQAPADAEQAP